MSVKTLNPSLPNDQTPVKDLAYYIRETREAMISEALEGAIFELGVKTEDAVWYNDSSGVWMRSLAGDPVRGKFHGIANVENGSVTISGFATFKSSIFVAGQTVYVSSTVLGGLTSTLTSIVAGTSITPETLVLDAQTQKRVDLLISDLNLAEAAITILQNSVNLLNPFSAEVTTARGILSSLGARLNVALNQDGTPKNSVTVSQWRAENSLVLAYYTTFKFKVLGNVSAVYGIGRRVRFNSAIVTHVLSAVYDVVNNWTLVETPNFGFVGTPTSIEYSLSTEESPRVTHADLLSQLQAVIGSSSTTGGKHITDDMASKWALLDSPTFTGIPNTPTPDLAAVGTQIANASYVKGNLALTQSNIDGLQGILNNHMAVAQGNITALQNDFIDLRNDIDALTLSEDLIVTVGPGGQYTTINAALIAITQAYTTVKFPGVSVTIQLLTGFVMAEQVLIKGLNLGWITITSVAATVSITRSALTTDFSTLYTLYPTFGVTGGGCLPNIGCLFVMDTSGDATNRIGIFLENASRCTVLANCGIKGAPQGLLCTAASTVHAKFSNFSSCLVNGLYCSGGHLFVPNSNYRKGTVDSISDLIVTFGGTVITNSATGGVPQTKNVPTANGIIYG